MRRFVSAALAIAALGTTAMASSPDAWTAYEKEVRDACFKASGLKNPETESKLIMFGDDVGRDALLIEGTYPQPHMNGAKGDMLCLFDKTTRTAVTSEIQDD